MYRLNRHGRQWRAAGLDSVATGDTPVEALRSLKRHEGDVLRRARRWVLYAASEDRAMSRFGEAVARAGAPWKPVAVDPRRLEDAVKALEPEVIVVAAAQRQDRALLRRAGALHGRRPLVVDDGHLSEVSKLLAARGVHSAGPGSS